MANFIEYVQMTKIKESSVQDAIRFFNISTAAFEFGNFIVAQENFARACSTLEQIRTEEVGAQKVYAEDLFDEFRSQMGDLNFNKFLHLHKEVNYFELLTILII